MNSSSAINDPPRPPSSPSQPGEEAADFPSTHPALQAGRIRGLSLPNRAVLAPMSRASTNRDGIPTPEMAAYYGKFSDGGFSLIVTEGTYTDEAYSQGYHGQPGIVDPAQEEGWRRVVDRVRASGGRIVLQLMHAGALSQHLERTAAPSEVRPLRKPLKGYGGDEYHLPLAMSPDDIAVASEGYAASAGRAEALGFDGVEIHGANGYLLDQFLTDYTNQRTDDYGGGVRNRARLTAEIIALTRRRVSADFVVGVRLSQGKVNDFDYLWPDGEKDGEIIFRMMAEAGADYIHFATEGKGYRHGSFSRSGVCLPRLRSGVCLPRLAKELTGLPVIANGALHDPEQARRVLEEGEADFIALATGALANPDWPRRLAEHRPVDELPADYFQHGVTLSFTPAIGAA